MTRRRPKPPALPAVGARYEDAQGVAWRVVAVYDTHVTLEAGGLRRTMTAERLAERMERVS